MKVRFLLAAVAFQMTSTFANAEVIYGRVVWAGVDVVCNGATTGVVVGFPSDSSPFKGDELAQISYQTNDGIRYWQAFGVKKDISFDYVMTFTGAVDTTPFVLSLYENSKVRDPVTGRVTYRGQLKEGTNSYSMICRFGR